MTKNAYTIYGIWQNMLEHMLFGQFCKLLKLRGLNADMRYANLFTILKEVYI